MSQAMISQKASEMVADPVRVHQVSQTVYTDAIQPIFAIPASEHRSVRFQALFVLKQFLPHERNQRQRSPA